MGQFNRGFELIKKSQTKNLGVADEVKSYVKQETTEFETEWKRELLGFFVEKLVR